MDSFKCKFTTHQDQQIISICLHNDCIQKRLCCLQCVSQFHGGHDDQQIETKQLFDFIQNKKNQKIKSQIYTLAQNQMSQSLEQLCKTIDDFKKIVEERLQEIRGKSLQEYLEQNGDMQFGIDSLNEFIENIFLYVEVDNGVLTQKKQQQSLLQNEKGQLSNIKQIEQSLQKLIKQFSFTTDLKELIFSQSPIQLIGHKGDVIQAIISQDGSIIVSASFDKTIKIWDSINRQQLNTIQHDEEVYRIALSQNNNYLAFSDSNYTVKLYNLRQNINLGVLKKDLKEILFLIFSGDNQFLLSGGNDTKLMIFSLIKRKQIHSFETNSTITMIVMSSDNLFISCICCDQGQINVWDFQTKAKLIEENNTHQIGLGLCSSTDSSIFISSGSEDESQGIIKLWKFIELQNKKRSFTLTNQINVVSKGIARVILTQDDKYFISICWREERIRIYERDTARFVQELNSGEQNESFTEISISNDLNTLVSINGHKKINVWTRE